ncbi:MAG: peptidase domain-containing ABC transporter [Bacteroidales bacterium]|nr:peptidase domain-containing ABC transporter [Bacteroidales bacterium]
MRSNNLKVKQRDLKDCGPACIASIAAHYNTYVPVAKIRDIAGTDKKGTSALGLIKAFESIGMMARGFRCKESYLDHIPVPTVAHFVLKNNVQHYVVVYNVSKNRVKIMDPASGSYRYLSREEFLSTWSGVLIITAPGKDYQPHGQKISNEKRFWYLLKPHKKIIIQAIFGALLYTLLGFSTSVYIQKLTDYMVVFKLKQALHVAGIIMIFIILFQIVLSVIKNAMILKTGQLIDARLIIGYYRHLLKLPQRFFDSMRVGEIISRINDAGKIRQFLSDSFINIILNAMIILFSVIILFVMHRELALIVVFIIPAYASIYYITNRLNKKQERKIMERSALLESQLVESLQNIRTVKQLNLENEMADKTEWRFIDLLNAGYRSGMNAIFSSSGSEFINKSFTLLLLWSGALLILRDELTLGQLISFYTILGYMSGPASRLIGVNRIYQNANIAADRLFEIMELNDKNSNGTMEVNDLNACDIQFREVDFAYGTRGALFKNLNLLIKEGNCTVIRGESGSGKSTIAHLITGLYRIDSGSLTIGNIPVRDIQSASLFRSIAVVPQHTDIFSGSLVSNIAAGAGNPDYNKAMELCQRLGMHDLIDSLPFGLHTLIGERGFTLSGGERQRISIARALYRDPSIIILDEATSSLDAESESRVMKIMKEEKKRGKTVLIISHKNTFLEEADMIITINKGKVEELADHTGCLKSTSERG